MESKKLRSTIKKYNNGGHQALIAKTSCSQQNLLATTEILQSRRHLYFLVLTASLNDNYKLAKDHGFLCIVPEWGGGNVGCLLK